MADTADIDARIAAARERYAEERAKRVKPKGDKQYSHLSGKFADFDTDPYVEPGFTREPIVEEFTAVILGGGFKNTRSQPSVHCVQSSKAALVSQP